MRAQVTQPVFAEAGKQWRAPALSSLVTRLAQPAGMPPQPSSPSRSKPDEDQHYLDPSSDEEEQETVATEPVVDDSRAEGDLSIYSAAAGPFRALLACITAEPGRFDPHAPLPSTRCPSFYNTSYYSTFACLNVNVSQMLLPPCGILVWAGTRSCTWQVEHETWQHNLHFFSCPSLLREEQQEAKQVLRLANL